MAVYTFGQLEDLWVRAGGPKRVAPVMAAIGLAESRGRPRAQHRNANGTVDRGLWQINSSHGYGVSSFVPLENARQAVSVYHSQGLRAWSTYTTGVYRQFLGGGGQGVSGGSSTSFGVYSSDHFAGTDQGVDFTGAGVIPALDPITVTSVRRVSIIEGGSYPLVGFRFDAGPYKGRYGYVMENFTPSVRVGQRLKRGQPIGVAAGQYPYIETGFASGPDGSPLAPLGSDPHAPTQAGVAYAAYVGQRIGSPLVSASGRRAVPTVNGVPITSDKQLKKLITGDLQSSGSPGALASHIPGVKQAEAVTSFLGKLLDPKFWLRALEVVGGIVLVMLGLYLLARNVGLASSPPGPVGELLPFGKAGQLSDSAAAEMQFSPGRAAAAAPRTRRQSFEVSEAGERRASVRRRAALATPSDEIPF